MRGATEGHGKEPLEVLNKSAMADLNCRINLMMCCFNPFCITIINYVR
jgi:hypothetical protein